MKNLFTSTLLISPIQKASRFFAVLLTVCTLFSWSNAAQAMTAVNPTGFLLAAKQLQGVINIQTASAEQLELLPRVGPALAERIIAYRTKHGLKSVEQLLRVKGIGRKTLAKMKPYLRTDGTTTLQELDGEGVEENTNIAAAP